MGVKVKLLRITSMGVPEVCFFEDATSWLFTANLLSIIQNNTSESSIITEFLTDGVESVEFGSKETA